MSNKIKIIIIMKTATQIKEELYIIISNIKAHTISNKISFIKINNSMFNKHNLKYYEII